MKYSAVFKALSDDTRLRILNLLLSAKGSLCVCEIVDALGLPQYLISRHLVILKNAGLIQSKKKGRWVHYSLNAQKSLFKQDFFAVIKKHLNSPVFRTDLKNLEARLLKRRDDKCGSLM